MLAWKLARVENKNEYATNHLKLLHVNKQADLPSTFQDHFILLSMLVFFSLDNDTMNVEQLL